MTAYDFSLVKNTTIAFNAATTNGDTLNFGGTTSAKDVTISTSGSSIILTVGADRLTLTGVTLAQLASTNVTFSDASVLLVGDNTADTALDVAGNTLNATTVNSAAAVNKNNVIFGLGAGDTIVATGTGNQVIYGGSGVGDATDGNDTITAGSGNNLIYANGGADSIGFSSANGTVTTIFGGAGDDAVTVSGASTGQGIIYGGEGSDSIVLTASAYAGNHTVFGGTGTVDPTDSADTITSGTGNAVVYGNAGNDTITLNTAAAGAATVYGGLGNDTITGSNTTYTPVIYGSEGADTITNVSGTGNHTIFGGTSIGDSADGADSITTGLGNAVVYANGGNDTITSSAADGSNTVVAYGGFGDDRFVYVEDDAADTNVISYTGGSGNDTYALSFATGDANIVISDFASGDIVNLTLSGGSAATMNVSGGGSSVVIFNDTGANGYTAGTDERITFAGYSGGFTTTNFVLSDGSKFIANFGGAATTLTGGLAADQLNAGNNGDTLIGGGAADKLVGGTGNDTFQFTAALATAFNGTAVTITGGTGTDVLEITDTNAATLQAADFTSTITGMETLKLSNASHDIGNGGGVGAAFTTAGFATINADALAGTNTLIVDVNNATAAVTIDADGATSTGVMTITSTTGAFNDVILTGAGNDIININTGTGNESINGGSGDDNVNIAAAGLTSGDTIIGGSGTADKITLTTISAAGDAVVDADFTSVATLEQLVLANGGSAQTVTLGTLASAAGLNYLNGLAETGHALTVDASSMTTGILIAGGDTGDSLTGGTGNDTLYGGVSSTVDTLVGGAGSDRYAVAAVATNASTANAVDIIVSSNFTAGTSGDVFDFDYTNSVFLGTVTETVLTSATTAVTAAALATNGIVVITQDAVGAVANIATAFNATTFDTTNVDNRVVVWEIDANTVGVAVVANIDTTDDNDVVATQVFSLTGFANQAAVDTFTSGLVAGNFDLI